MNRVIRCTICGNTCPLDEALNGIICPDCCEDMGLDDDYEGYDDEQ